MASGGPCAACKFLRRKCAAGCVFAPYFGSDEQGPARFAAIHKVFGASNASKLLLHVPLPERCEAVLTIVYEAQARIQDPVYGCVAHILALQHQVASLQAQLIYARAQLARRMAGMQLAETQWQGSVAHPILHSDSCATPVSPQSSLDQIDHSTDGEMIRGVCFKEHSPTQICTRRVAHNELGELQALAQRMMRN